jgi:hypothetical protein
MTVPNITLSIIAAAAAAAHRDAAAGGQRGDLARSREKLIDALVRLGASGPVAETLATLVEGEWLCPADAVEFAGNLPRGALDELIADDSGAA